MGSACEACLRPGVTRSPDRKRAYCFCRYSDESSTPRLRAIKYTSSSRRRVLNPFTERSLCISRSRPEWDYTSESVTN